MVIVSSILERDETHGDILANTAGNLVWLFPLLLQCKMELTLCLLVRIFECVLITCANGLYPDQARQNIMPDLDPIC